MPVVGVARPRGQVTSVKVRLAGDLVWVPASWTDMAREDVFVRQAGGRALLGVSDLIAVADLLDTLTRTEV